jgi:hypothetical protein
VGLCFLSALPSCSPRIIEKVRTEYVTQEVHHRDTIITRDSVYIREWMKGDTVFVDRFRDRYVYRDRWRDSVRVQVDSFVVERVKEVQVEKHLSWGKRAKIAAFWWLVAAVAALGAWTFRKPLTGLVTKILKRIF